MQVMLEAPFRKSSPCKTVAWALFSIVAVASSSGTAWAKKSCDPGCTKRGNCNEEEGRCECPWGYTGPACEVDRMASCRQTPDDPGSCGYFFPKNCECYRSCFRLYCSRYGRDVHRCHSDWGRWIEDAPCFLHKGVGQPGGRAAQDSWLPDDLLGNATWYQQIPEMYGKADYDQEMLLKNLSLAPRPPYFRPHVVWRQHGFEHTAHPLYHCPNNCTNGRGVCQHYHGEEAPRCWCHNGYNGTDCSGVDSSEACWFSPDCGGRGTCVAGFCHCQPGYWGLGCARSQAHDPPGEAEVGADGLVATRSLSSFKIYMYELPWDIAFPWEQEEWAHTRDALYAAYEYFMRYFIKDTVVRTENPAEASLFYVPTQLYTYAGNVGDPTWHMEVVLDYVRQKFPYYNRSGGADHFMFMTGDRGACRLPRSMQDGFIKVVNFGMQRAGGWDEVRNTDYACIQLKRDVVVPPQNAFVDVLPDDTVAYYEEIVRNKGADPKREVLFAFAGGVGDGTIYSGGTRQAIAKLLKSLNPVPSDVLFHEGRSPEYRKMLKTSKFCIAPYGFGWGIRLIQAIEHGCIPVVIQDYVYQAFEDFLPYDELSVRMPLADVPRMIEILRQYTDSDLARLRLGMAKHFRAFIWDRAYGGQAYEWTVAALQRRAAHLQAQLFRRRRALQAAG